MDKIPSWFILAVVTLILWGFWGFFSKLATQYIDPKSALIWQVLGALLIGVIVLVIVGFKPETHGKGVLFAFLTGVCVFAGILTFLYALTKGKTSVVVTMTALYPLVVIFLSYVFLQETLSLKEALGVCFAITAMILFSW